MDFERIRYEQPEEGVVRIMLARREKKNAQDQVMLYEINEAFTTASRDDSVKVIILAAEGADFSSGHEVGPSYVPKREPVSTWNGYRSKGAEQVLGVEQEIFVEMCMRWRELPTPTIAQVQGRCIAGGLMLVWPCDLVVASEDARFSDPTLAFGLNGLEYFAHLYELGARRAKELLFTGGYFTAEEAHRIGMVNRVVPLENLEESALELARKIARMPSIGLKLAKMSVNQSQDNQGFVNSINAAYSMHLAAHTHAMVLHQGKSIDRDGKKTIRELSGAVKP